MTNLIDIDIISLEQELQLLKNDKIKLEELLNKTRISKDNLVNSNLSGKTFNESVRDNNIFVKTINNRIIQINDLIVKLEKTINLYKGFSSSVNKSLQGEII